MKRSKNLIFVLPLVISLYSLIDDLTGTADSPLDFYIIKGLTLLISSCAVTLYFLDKSERSRFELLSLLYVVLTSVGIIITLFHSRTWDGEFWDKFCFILGLPFSELTRFIYFESGLENAHSIFLILLDLISTLTIPLFLFLVTRSKNSKAKLSDSDNLFCRFCGNKIPVIATLCLKCGERQEDYLSTVEKSLSKDEVENLQKSNQESLNDQSLQFRREAGNRLFSGSIPREKGNDNFLWVSVITVSLVLVFFTITALIKSSNDLDALKPHSELTSESPVNNLDDNCLKLEVESPFDVADFYAFQVYITNTCEYRVSIKGYFYVKTENGAIYERPSDSMINFHGNNICGITGNYLDYIFNPASTEEYSSDSVCNSVRSGDTVVSYFIANEPDGEPSLELNGRWTLN